MATMSVPDMPEPRQTEQQEAEHITRQMHAQARTILECRPRKVDMGKLRKDVISRFPKILAALAEGDGG